MNLNSLSWSPVRPCFLLKWSNATVLVDCALDLSSLNSFLPHTYFPVNLSSADFDPRSLKRIREFTFVEGTPEVHPTPLHAVQMESVDCVLISTWNSFIALPFYVHNTGFRGRIFATSPVIQFGKLLMEEFIEYCERIPFENAGDEWKKPEIFIRFVNPPYRNPLEWKKFYTKEAMNEVLATTTPLSFKQTFTIVENISITAHPSGCHIGSCNWTINADNVKIGFLGASSSTPTHVKPAIWDGFRDLDVLSVTSLTPVPDYKYSENVARARDVVLDTLKGGGNALLPMLPVGAIFDFLETIARSIENTNGISIDTPVYFVSPVAKSAIAFASVNSEWLAEDRQHAIYGTSNPEEPFLHNAFVRGGRLKVYDSLFEPFSKEIRTPCVMFCGHPSLRIGDAAHMLQLWGNDTRNCLVMTNPDFPLSEVYGPFQDLKIRAYYYPIDTRFTFPQVDEALKSLKPRNLYVPEQYLPISNTVRPDMCITYTPCTPMGYDETLLISHKRAKKRKIKLHPDIIKRLEAKPHPSNPDLGPVCSLSGYLSVFDDAYELMPAMRQIGALSPKYLGILTVEALIHAFQNKKFDALVENENDGTSTISVPALKAEIQLSADGLRTKIRCPPEMRNAIIDVVTAPLTKLC